MKQNWNAQRFQQAVETGFEFDSSFEEFCDACMDEEIVRKETAPQTHDAGKSAGQLSSNNIDNRMPLNQPI